VLRHYHPHGLPPSSTTPWSARANFSDRYPLIDCRVISARLATANPPPAYDTRKRAFVRIAVELPHGHRQGVRRLPAELRRLEGKSPRSSRLAYDLLVTARAASPSAMGRTSRRTTWARSGRDPPDSQPRFVRSTADGHRPRPDFPRAASLRPRGDQPAAAHRPRLDHHARTDHRRKQGAAAIAEPLVVTRSRTRSTKLACTQAGALMSETDRRHLRVRASRTRGHSPRHR